jgi:hypothetical protein
MHRLVVNPGTPQAWEIQLRPGTNRLGRAESNDFQISDPSISSSHCHILVNGDSVTITDLGSTNGTFVNRAQVVQEAKLEDGHAIRLGTVETVFYAGTPAPAAVVSPPPPPPSPPMAPRMSLRISGAASPPPVTVAAPSVPNQALETGEPPPPPMAPRMSLRISGAASPPPVAVAAPSVPDEALATGEPPPPPLAPVLPSGPRFCKFHPKSPARYLCTKCNRTFCELCVTSRTVGKAAKKMCRSCGIELVPLQVQISRAKQRGFFSSLPGAFIFPFRGIGVLILICAAIVFAVLGAMSAGLFAIVAKVIFYGFVFLFMQNIIFTTTSDEKENLSLPDTDGFIGAFFTLLGTILLSYGLAIGGIIARLCGVDIPVGAIVACVILGCLYFPMALLAAAMKDTALAANPLIVIPAILKTWFHYLIACILLMAVFGFRQLGEFISSLAGDATLTTRETSVFVLAIGLRVVWSFVSVYMLTVMMRVLGLFYNVNKEKLGWF